MSHYFLSNLDVLQAGDERRYRMFSITPWKPIPETWYGHAAWKHAEVDLRRRLPYRELALHETIKPGDEECRREYPSSGPVTGAVWKPVQNWVTESRYTPNSFRMFSFRRPTGVVQDQPLAPFVPEEEEV